MNSIHKKVSVRPAGALQILSRYEVAQLCDQTDKGLNDLLTRCALAVLTTGSKQDNSDAMMAAFPDFRITVSAKGRGLQLEIENAPRNAFVDDTLIVGIQEHLSAVIRDLLYARNQILLSDDFDLTQSSDITNAIFHFSRNAQLLIPNQSPNVIVCWGGHAITLAEYKYTKQVGYQLGLRLLDICTGCGPGAMHGPMKGAVLGHSKQRHGHARYIGLSEPDIIAAEAPNAIVSELTIFPDIEKRLEAFVRLGHGIIVFPGGAGTLEEILYLLTIMLHPKNKDIPFPVVLTAPEAYRDYFDSVLDFIENALGSEAVKKFKLFIGQPEAVAAYMAKGLEDIREFRKANSDAYYFNWRLHIPYEVQQPFEPNHNSMKQLNLYRDQAPYLLASQLRKAFSGIVAGNVKSKAVAEVAQKGPFEIHGDPALMNPLEKLMEDFVLQKRLKLGDENYTPCYKIVT